MMFGTVAKISFFLASAAISVRADPTPTNPGPGDVFIEGQSCAIGWDADPTGTWKKTQIDLMTGDNFNMVYLTTIAVVDTTNPSQTTYSYTCPKVTPHSPIYFYQFSAPSLPSANKSWTGRFTITDTPSDIVPPAQSTQPDGEKIPWGTGALVNGSSSLVPPSVSGSATAASSGSGAAPSSGAPSTPTTSSGGSPATPSSQSSMSVMTVTSSVVVVPTTAIATSTAGANGAVALVSASNIVFQAGLVLGLAAVGFAMVV